MSSARRPRLRDVRRVYRLLGECGEIGSDATAWRQHLLQGIGDIVGARVGLYMHIHNPLAEEERLDAEVAYGFLDSDHLALWAHYREHQAQRDDLFHHSYFRNHPRRLRASRLDDVVATREWRRSRHYNEYVRACGLSDRLVSALPIAGKPDAPLQTLVLHRDFADGDFKADSKYLLALLHHELAGQLGQRLVLPASLRDTGALPPRMAQVVEGLLKGESEKQIAARLGISPHTVNRHVQRVYRHFQVGNRAQLIALLVGDVAL